MVSFMPSLVILVPASLPACGEWYLRHRLRLCILVHTIRVLCYTYSAGLHVSLIENAGLEWLSLGIFQQPLAKVPALQPQPSALPPRLRRQHWLASRGLFAQLGLHSNET